MQNHLQIFIKKKIKSFSNFNTLTKQSEMAPINYYQNNYK